MAGYRGPVHAVSQNSTHYAQSLITRDSERHNANVLSCLPADTHGGSSNSLRHHRRPAAMAALDVLTRSCLL